MLLWQNEESRTGDYEELVVSFQVVLYDDKKKQNW